MEYFKITETELKTSEILQKCKDKFPVWSYLDDNRLDKDFPLPKKITTRYFKKNIEADEELKNKSAEDLEKEYIEGITLRERLLLELQYFEETGKHLDIKNITICSGSRDLDGYVPYVFWYDVKLQVSWSNPSYRNAGLRSREVVTLDSFSFNPSDLESRVKSLENQVESLRKFLVF